MFATIQFTQKGYEKIKKDLQDLSEKRKEIITRLQIAREMGDLSENGAYKAARFELGGVDREIRKCMYLLRCGKIVDGGKKDSIDFGSLVTIENGEKRLTFTLVGPYESDPSQNKLSTKSPIGKAVLGKRAGEKVVVSTPQGTVLYTIIHVK